MGVFGTTKMKLFAGVDKVKKAYLGTEKIYSAGNIVTYYVDSGVTRSVEMDSDVDILSDESIYIPEKDGWTFVGWREDRTASADVLDSKIMGDEPIALYAVFSKKVTATFISYGSTQYVHAYKYYNNGGEVNPDVICPEGTSYSGWTWYGWSAANDRSPGTNALFDKNSTLQNLWSDFTYYGLYYQDIYLHYSCNGSDTHNTGRRYYNASGNTLNPTFTISNPTISGATFKGWSTSASSSSIVYSSISDLDLSEGLTVYSVFTYDTVTKSVNSGNGTVQTYTIYIDNTKYSKITLASSAENNMCSARIYTPSGGEICICHTSVGLTQSTTSFVTGTYTVETRSNYAYASTTSTLTLTGKTVVG